MCVAVIGAVDKTSDAVDWRVERQQRVYDKKKRAGQKIGKDEIAQRLKQRPKITKGFSKAVKKRKKAAQIVWRI